MSDKEKAEAYADAKQSEKVFRVGATAELVAAYLAGMDEARAALTAPGDEQLPPHRRIVEAFRVGDREGFDRAAREIMQEDGLIAAPGDFDAVRAIVRDAVEIGCRLGYEFGVVGSPESHKSGVLYKQYIDDSVADFTTRLTPHLARGAADDSTPVDESWLAWVCRGLYAGVGYLLGNDFSFMNSSDGWHLMIRRCDEDGNEADPMRLVPVPTRGAVRRLAAALGVSLKPESV